MGRSRFLNVKLNVKVPSLGECFCNTSAQEEKDNNHQAIGKALSTLRDIKRPELIDISQETDSDNEGPSKQIVASRNESGLTYSDAKRMEGDINFLKASIMQHKAALQQAKMENQYLQIVAMKQKQALSEMVNLAAADKDIARCNQTALDTQYEHLMHQIESPVSPAAATLQIAGGSVVDTDYLY